MPPYKGRADQGLEAEWAALMIAANGGDEVAYARFLKSAVPVLRNMARRGLARAGANSMEAEDIVQEALLAIHLKRQTWREQEPITPWIAAIVRHKLLDCFRRQGRRAEVQIDDEFADLFASDDPAPEEGIIARQAAKFVDDIGGVSAKIIRLVSIEGASVKEAAEHLGMTEGAVRVALHRGLKRLAETYGRQEQ